MTIADLRKMGPLDGTVARILNKRAQIFQDDPTRSSDDALNLRNKAFAGLKEILSLRGGDRIDINRPVDDTLYPEDAAFDKLVPCFFR